MDIRQLEAVVAIARLSSFTRAADELFVAQPALSATVKRLENELGLRLFDRTTRRVTLTPAGEAFVRRAERVLGDLRELRAEMAEHAGATRGRLRIGAWYTVDPWLPEMVAPFHAAHPSVDVTVREVNSDRMLDLLRAGDLDVALPVLRPGLDLDEIELLPYIEEPFVLAAPAGSTLAAMRSVTLADVAGEPLITFNPGSSLRRLVEQAFAASGLEPRVALETIETSAARAMVSSGLGVAILPASVAQRPGPPVAVVPLDAPPVRRSAFAWRRGPGSPARDAFLVTASRWRDGRGEPSRPGRGGAGSREGGAQADARRPMGEALRARDAAEAAHAKSEGAAQKAEQDAIARASSPGSSLSARQPDTARTREEGKPRSLDALESDGA